jgi:hypothetical protein
VKILNDSTKIMLGILLIQPSFQGNIFIRKNDSSATAGGMGNQVKREREKSVYKFEKTGRKSIFSFLFRTI